MISVTVRGGLRGDNPFANFDWTKRATAWANRIAPPLRQEMKHEAPVKTGQLRDKIFYQRTISAGLLRLRYGSGARYARWVVRGARPHVIRPVAAKALRFRSPDGNAVFAKIVHHPGNRPNPFPQRAIASMREDMQNSLSEIMRERS